MQIESNLKCAENGRNISISLSFVDGSELMEDQQQLIQIDKEMSLT